MIYAWDCDNYKQLKALLAIDDEKRSVNCLLAVQDNEEQVVWGSRSVFALFALRLIITPIYAPNRCIFICRRAHTQWQ
jgi:hypothetical protein